MKSRYLTVPLYTSPLLLVYVLGETFMNDAYPVDGDIIMIPFMGYMLLCYPLTLYLELKLPRGNLTRPSYKLWNPHRHVFSFFSLMFTIYPLAASWAGFLEVAIRSLSYGSMLVCTMMVIVLVLTRTYAIQDLDEPEATPLTE